MRRIKSTRWTIVIALGALLAAPFHTGAQSTTQSTQKQATSQPTKKKTAATAKPAAAAPLTLEPKALDVLKATSDRLAAAHTLTFTAVETFESLSRQGAPLVYANKFEVAMQRPDKIRVTLAGDGPTSEFYDDGKIVMAYAPAENLVAIADAQSTIDKTLEAVYHAAGIYFPFTDVIVANPYGDMAPGLKHAYYVGQSHIVAGITTDIVAFAGDGIFAEMWVGADDKLPRIIHAIYLDDPDHLRHNLVFSDWQLESNVTSDAFTSSKAAGANKMPFAHPNATPGPGAKPLKRTAPSNSQ